MVSSPFAAPGPRERQRLETRARLFRAAIDEFRRAGFSGASVARIAEKAGVSRPSFYFHFPTREHVLLELQWNLEQQIVERFERCSSLAECLEVLAVSHAEHFEWIGNREVSREMLRIYARPPEELPVPLDSQPFPVFVELGRRFAEAAQRGELRRGLDPADATYLCLTGYFGYLICSDDPPEEQRRQIRTLFSLYLEH